MANVNAAIALLKKDDFDRAGLEDLMKRRFIIAPSFQIYSGVAGLYDYGPIGCAVKANLIALWRQHFVLAEDMLEVDCSALTPEPVLKTSGHVDRFADFMVRDVKTGNCFRADHLLEAHLEKLIDDPKVDKSRIEEYKLDRARAGDMKQTELTEAFAKYNIKAPDTNNDVEPPFSFNLMFKTSIGPTGQIPGYLRPETAQGIFVNFRRLLDYNGGKLPFAAAQIGNAYRNEIAPRSGLLRVREFTMAEIEHFVSPHDKNTPKFATVADLHVNLLTADSQGKNGDVVTVRLRDAVREGVIDNETLAYFLGRTQLFLVTAGINPHWLRFRQHQANEMSHYANDCWDAEIFTSYGWVECVGHADRGCYDLSRHSSVTNTNLQYYEEFKSGPKLVKVMKPNLNKPLVGKSFKGDQKLVVQFLETIEFDSAQKLEADLAAHGNATITAEGKSFTLTREMVTFTPTEEKISGVNVIPNVIEPSFGLGRIIYAILEHAYRVRDGEKAEKKDPTDKQGGEIRAYLALTPIIAPVKASVLPLIQSDAFVPFTKELTHLLKAEGLSCKVDETGAAIGRRYARTDEIGIPFGITVDHDTLKDKTVTLRERNTTNQVRVPLAEVAPVVRKLSDNVITWDNVVATYPAFVSVAKDQ